MDRNKKTGLIIAGAAALLGCVGVGAALIGRAGPHPGAVLYDEHCAGCHGADLEGQPDWQTPGADGVLPAPPHDTSGHTWHHGDRLLFDYTRFGGARAMEMRGVDGFASGMPAFDGVLTRAQTGDVLDYIKSTWSDRERAVQAGRSAAE
jgi:mono/diheme cytochrome c family protein